MYISRKPLYMLNITPSRQWQLFIYDLCRYSLDSTSGQPTVRAWTLGINLVKGDKEMRITTLLSAAAIATLTTINPVLAYGPSTEDPSFSYLSSIPKEAMSDPERGKMEVAFAVVKETAAGYVLVRNDGGRATPFRNCENSEKCTTDYIWVLINSRGSAQVELDCGALGGCVMVGKP